MKIYILSFLALFCALFGYTQVDTTSTDSTLILPMTPMVASMTVQATVPYNDFYEKITPLSPNSSELGRYGSTPVGKFTGTIQQNILLYEFKTNNLDLPISISYSSNGLLVDKTASWVGMDWALNAGGAITRTVNGYPDNESNRRAYPTNIDTNQQELYNFMYSLRPAGADPNYFDDIEPDVFNYNFAGYVGKFVLDHLGNPIFIPFEKLKIESTNNLLGFVNYSITTPDGIIYEFKEFETGMYNNSFSFITSLYLTKIIHPVGDEITFHYTNGNYFNNGGIYQRVTEHLQTTSGNPVPAAPEDICRVTSQQQRMVYLDSITSNGFGKVIFYKSGRIDSYAELKLDKISVLTQNNKILKSVSFSYQFPIHDNSYPAGTEFGIHSSSTGEYKYRMFLQSISFNEKSELPVQQYGFEYYDLEQLPCRFSFAQDHWGFFNGKSNSSFVDDTGVSASFINLTSVSFADKNPDWTYSKKGMLQKVTYPTGGSSEFFYEANEYANQETGGCRIQQIKTKASSTTLPQTKTYLYPDGKTFGLPSYYDEYVTYTSELIGNYCFDYAHTFGVVSSSSLLSLYSKQNNNVVYQFVTEIDGDTINSNGKKLYTYDYEMDSPGMPVSGSYGGLVYPISNSNNGWINGTLLKIAEYDKNNDPVKTTEYFYNNNETNNSNILSCLSANFLETPPCGFVTIPGQAYLEYLPYIQTTKYYIYSRWHYLSQKSVTEYASATNSIITQTIYSYGNPSHAQLTKESTTNSDNDVIEIRYSYPEDYASLSYFSTLINRNIVSKPIDTRTYNNNQLISGTQTEYNNDGQPIKTYVAEIEDNVSDIEFEANNPYKFTLKGEYEYNTDKMLKQVSPVENNNSSYILSYNNSYPVVKAENVDYNTLITAVESAASTSDLESFWGNLTTVTHDNSTWNSFNSNLRNNPALQDAMITTYTYEPLVGMTSQTDPAGRTTYYEYDDFGRLKQVRDQKGNILKKHEYHYVGQAN